MKTEGTSLVVQWLIVVQWLRICLPLQQTQVPSQVALVLKNLTASVGDIRDAGLIPGLGRSPGGGHGNPIQDSCLENPMDRGAWLAMVQRIAKSWTRVKRLSMYACVVGVHHRLLFWG